MDLPNQTYFLLVTALVLVWWFHSKWMTEKFDPSWQNDVFLLRGYLGTEITATYNYLRDKYAQLLLAGSQPYIPTVGDPALSDPYLVSVRSRLRGLIDSWLLLMKNKYGAPFVDSNILVDGVIYHNNIDGTLLIHNIVDSESHDFLV